MKFPMLSIVNNTFKTVLPHRIIENFVVNTKFVWTFIQKQPFEKVLQKRRS